MDNYLIVACAQSVDGVPSLVRLLPLGVVNSQQGQFVVDAESFEAMCESFVGRGLDLVIDYEHQTLKDVQAPAGGWIKELVLSDNAICGRVEWTAKATEYLKNKEYRYLSPVIMVRSSDRKVLELKSAALTNTPAIDNMFPIINSENFTFNKGESSMELLKQLAALLGLAEGAAEADVLAAVQGLLNRCEVVANKTILSLLSLKDTATTAEVAAKITTLQNPAGFVPVEQYNLVANKLNTLESGDLVEQALKDGKIIPAQKEWAQQYVLSDKAGFESFLKAAAPIVPMQKIAPGQATVEPQKAVAIDPVICKSLGITAGDIEKYGKEDE